ncbi:MAG: DUF3592 domain-containing protein [Holophagaceae bacterium]|jgi:hypothetical protein|uniref:DUF3592 domain-containing protein n=1 Tax=Candidatus Geothrix odensensis TaxID=2954440 RepID=A0A936F3I0_9BACT|nr:DUF3592 domain-containing protein [Candidatus Geothrix odensensis]
MLLLFAAFSLLTGAALLALSLWLRSRSQQCLQWPSVTGHVIESRVDDTHLDMMKPVLRYRYEVGPQSYIGFRVSFSGYVASRSAMEKLIKPYSQGSAVTVYYDPQNPSSAVLNNTQTSDWLYWLAFGLGFLVLAAYLTWL